MNPPALRLSAIIVNYNAGRHLVTCVRSLRDEGVDEIIVADSASTDDSLAQLARSDDEVVIVPGPNQGFGAGVNRGVAVASRRDFLLLLNPDVVVEPGAVKVLIDALDRDRDVAIAGPAIRTLTGGHYPSARKFPALGDALGHAFLGVVWPRNPFTRRYRMLDWDASTTTTVDWLSGSCLLVRRDVWDELGGFDEGYFMYAEDVDLCFRAWRRGWHVLYEPDARVTHAQGVSTDQVPYRMIAAHHRSLFRFAVKTTTGWKRATLPAVAAGLAVRTVLAWLHRLVTGRFRSADV